MRSLVAGDRTSPAGQMASGGLEPAKSGEPLSPTGGWQPYAEVLNREHIEGVKTVKTM